MPPLQRHKQFHKLTHGKAVMLLLIAAVLAVSIVVGIWLGIKKLYDMGQQEVEDRSERAYLYDRQIRKVAQRHGVDPELIRALIWKETGGTFDPDTRGKAGEVGLMQVLPKASVTDWARINRRKLPTNLELTDPELNIEIGTWYLARALKYWRKYDQQIELALCEYNAGRTRAERWKPEKKDGNAVVRIDIDSTKSYVTDIMKKYREYQSISKNK